MSEGITVPLGDELPLSFTLPAGANGLFPQAFVTDDADVAVAGSPFDLTEIGATARYTRFPAASFSPAAVGSFTARFVVFSDAGHLVEALEFTRDQDSFEVISDDRIDVGWARLDAGNVEVTVSAKRAGADTPLVTAAIEFFNSDGTSRFVPVMVGPDAQGLFVGTAANVLVVQASYWVATVTDAFGPITFTGHVPFTF